VLLLQTGRGDELHAALADAIAAGAEFVRDTVRSLAPQALLRLIDEVGAAGGIFPYLKGLVASTFQGLFGALQGLAGGTPLEGIVATFRTLGVSAGEILGALASGDCGPLFAAVQRLGDAVSTLAGQAWDTIVAFCQPIGDFFSQLWQDFGAPVVDWLKKTAGALWADVQQLGARIWSWTEPVRSALGAAWDWVKRQLGIGADEGNGEGGLIQWVQGKLGQVWAEIQETLRPVIQPVRDFAARVAEFLPLNAILNLRETVQGWLARVNQMAQTMTTDAGDDSAGVVQNQDVLRNEILPAVLQTIQGLRAGLIDTGTWVAGKVGAIGQAVGGLLGSLRANQYLSPLAGALGWVESGVNSLVAWAQEAVTGLFTLLGDGLVSLSRFIRPVLDLLQEIVTVLGDLLGQLPGLVLGPVWNAIPACIRNPITDFVTKNILSKIPVFGQLMAIPDIWEKLKETALRVLKQVFVDGDLLRAAWTFFSSILNLLNFPAKLIPEILGKAATVFGDILRDPVGFFMNLLGAVKEGFGRFFDNAPTHLLTGALDWLFGQVAEVGITKPPDFSLGSIFGLILQILGVSVNHVFERLEKKVNKTVVDRLRAVVRTLTGAWRWVSILIEQGPAGIWEEIKSQLGNLKDMVIDAVVQWISQKVVEKAIQKVISMLDPTGIMAVVNSLIALYNAIESFLQYLEQMLQIVNRVLDGLAGIVAGAIDQAAQFLETALARAIPIAIGFLMNQVGLGRIGERIRETVQAVRAKVDAGIDWLIDKAVAGGQAFLSALGLGGEQAPPEGQTNTSHLVIDTFEEGGEGHEIFLDLAQPTPQLMVASNNPQDIDGLLTHLADRLTEIPNQQRRSRAQELIGIVRATNTKLEQAGTASKREKYSGRLGYQMRELFEIFCISRRIPATTGEDVGSMQMFVEITLGSATGLVSPAAGTRIEADPNRDASNEGRAGGVVLPPRPATAGRTFVQAKTWSTGDPRGRADNASHAEHHFVNWFAQQPATWKAQVRALEIHNRTLSPCSSCSEELAGLLRDNPQIRTALLFWSKPYVLEPITTREHHFAMLRGVGWTVYPGPEKLDVERSHCPRR
jgi:phage-related protein